MRPSYHKRQLPRGDTTFLERQNTARSMCCCGNRNGRLDKCSRPAFARKIRLRSTQPSFQPRSWGRSEMICVTWLLNKCYLIYFICIFFIYLVLVSEPNPLQLAIPVGAGNGTNFAVGIAKCDVVPYRYRGPCHREELLCL